MKLGDNHLNSKFTKSWENCSYYTHFFAIRSELHQIDLFYCSTRGGEIAPTDDFEERIE